MFKARSEAEAEAASHIDEMIGNQKTVRAFGQEAHSAEKFKEISTRLEKYSLRAIFFSSLTNPTTRFVNNIVYAAVALVGALLAISSFGAGGALLTIGEFSVLLSYTNQYTKPFNEISGIFAEFQNALASAERVFALIDERTETPDGDDAAVLDTVAGNVSLDSVSFSYTKDKELIENFNLDVAPGQRIAIVGPTGCGKTTLINLLMRFYDVNEGSISVDGRDIRLYTRDSLRKAYTMVLQDTWLFNGTIFENIAYGKENATAEEVKKAAVDARIDSYIEHLTDGYNTVLTDDGTNISKGQKQLITIARAMLSDSPMLILDEATSNVDSRTEVQISKAMEKLMKGRTSFIIAHRLSTIKNADLILVLQNGVVTESGTHDELIALGGFYESLYNSQFK
jgi:ATP-binding cassette subfamily B protein